MFAAVCDLGLEGIVFKEAQRALSFRTVKKLDQGQEPKSASGDAGS